MTDRHHQFHQVHRLIRDLGRTPALQARFASSPEEVFSEFGLSSEEIDALKEGSIASLERIDVNPIVRMHWLMMSDPEAAAHMSIKEYIPKFEAGARDG